MASPPAPPMAEANLLGTNPSLPAAPAVAHPAPSACPAPSIEADGTFGLIARLEAEKATAAANEDYVRAQGLKDLIEVSRRRCVVQQRRPSLIDPLHSQSLKGGGGSAGALAEPLPAATAVAYPTPSVAPAAAPLVPPAPQPPPSAYMRLQGTAGATQEAIARKKLKMIAARPEAPAPCSGSFIHRPLAAAFGRLQCYILVKPTGKKGRLAWEYKFYVQSYQPGVRAVSEDAEALLASTLAYESVGGSVGVRRECVTTLLCTYVERWRRGGG